MAQDTTDTKDRKFSILFDWFDHTNDGWVTHDDFETMTDLFTAVLPPTDQENRNALREAFAAWWQILLDTGGADAEGRVGRAEFIAIMRANVTHPEHFEHAVLAIIDTLMRALDTDGSGSLSFDEYVRMYDALKVGTETSTAAFHRLDCDHDGVISHAEFRAAIEEFYLGSDAEGPGHWLLGSPLEPDTAT